MAAELAWLFTASTSSQLPAGSKEPGRAGSISAVFVTVETKDKRDGTGEEDGEGEERES